jgi:hypothetical protein
MVTVCAWCERYLGSVEPLKDTAISHGICPECVERERLAEAPVLIVSRERAPAVPMLQTLLRGAPEIAIRVERRGTDRRRGNGRANGHGRPARHGTDRRSEDRRRAPSFYLV